MTEPTRRLLDYGTDAVLLECAGLADALGLLPLLPEIAPQVSEVVPGARTLLLRLSAPLGPKVRHRLLSVPGRPVSEHDRDPVTIDVDYSGADLTEVAQRTGLTTAEVVERHTGQLWSVAFCGFAPGFGYLRANDPGLEVPRRTTPRTRVPAGSVGLAGFWSGVYPRDAPGGWQLIGRTEATLWDLSADPPALLQPGGRVRFRAV